MASEAARSTEHLLPLYCIGDSHTEVLNGVLLRDARTGALLAVGSSLYAIPTVAAELSDPQAGISATLFPLLYATRLISFARRDSETPTFHFAQHVFSVHSYAQRRWLMLFIGEFDARFVIERVPLDATLAIPGFDLSPFPPFPARGVVDRQAIEAEIARRLEPLINLVKQLRLTGITRVALTSIPPPTLDDAEYLRLVGIESRASTRYAVHWLVNRTLAARCAAEGIAFVDTWPEETENNVVRPGLLLDGVHLGREAALLKLRAYYELVRADGSAQVADAPSVF